MASVKKTTTKNGDTRYRSRFRDNEGRSRERWFPRKSEAERFAVTTEADKARGLYIDPRAGRATTQEWIEQCEASNLARRASTVARDRSYIDNYILPFFGSQALVAIRASSVASWLASLEAKGLAPATVAKAFQLLKRSLEAAVDDGLIARNPARRVKPPRIEPSEKRFLDVDEIQALAGAIEPRYRAMILTAAWTGLRLGETIALKNDRINMLRARLRVVETASEVKGRLHWGSPKTDAANRTVAMPKVLVDEIAAHMASYPLGEDGLLFTASEGGAVRHANFRRRAFDPAVKASVGTPCRFHDLRHSHAALLIREGVHPKVIQQRLGHKSITTTMDTYGHLFDGLDEDAADLLNTAIRQRTVGLAWG